jgi:hypothetical protein
VAALRIPASGRLLLPVFFPPALPPPPVLLPPVPPMPLVLFPPAPPPWFWASGAAAASWICGPPSVAPRCPSSVELHEQPATSKVVKDVVRKHQEKHLLVMLGLVGARLMNSHSPSNTMALIRAR